jgi:bifunctional non-homologous end joining protein LigD
MSSSRELHCQLNRIEPCLPRFAKKPPAGPGWIHEIKHDGFRIIAVRDGARVRLLTRKGIDLARRFAQIAAAIAVLPVRSCIIDGEAIACDANGLAVFDLLRYRRRDHAVALCAFDLLELEGYDTRRTPIEERKGALAKLLGGAQDGIAFSEHYSGEGAIFYKHACALGCEGVGGARGHARRPEKVGAGDAAPFPPPWSLDDLDKAGMRLFQHRSWRGPLSHCSPH